MPIVHNYCALYVGAKRRVFADSVTVFDKVDAKVSEGPRKEQSPVIPPMFRFHSI